MFRLGNKLVGLSTCLSIFSNTFRFLADIGTKKLKTIVNKTKNNLNGLLFSSIRHRIRKTSDYDTRLSDCEECLKFLVSCLYLPVCFLLRSVEICSLNSVPFDYKEIGVKAELFALSGELF